MDFHEQLVALSQVIMIDLVLAGDNAIVVGLAASRVAPALRARVVFWGVAGAVVLRILLALVATQLLAVVGLTLAGGIVLLWVCWKMFRELRMPAPELAIAGQAGGSINSNVRAMTFGAALTQIVVADVSMSLDNVLAVAGAAKGEIWILVIGLAVAVAGMATLSAYLANMLARHRWITWIGLLVILFVALEMIWTGTHQIGCELVARRACEDGVLSTLRALLS